MFEKISIILILRYLAFVLKLSSFAIQLHGRLTKEELNRYFGMRVHSIELMSLKKPIELGFMYPNYVRELVVTTLVSPRVFSSMCQIFTEVQALRVVSTFKSDTTFDPSSRDASVESLKVLRKLREVDITIHGFGTRGLWSCETFNVIMGGSLIFSHLTIVNINMMMHHEEIESFFMFLIRHRKSLKCVTARIGCMVTSVLGAWPDVNVKFSESPWFEEVKDLNLQSLHIFRAHTCGKCDIDDVWSAILQNQSALVKLTADYRDVETMEFFDILNKNPKLRSCSVYRLSCNFHVESPVVDSRYNSLEELTLEFVSNVVLLCNYLGIHQVHVDFLDFKNLPSTLRKLSIRGYTLPQSQFIAALKDLKYVEELNLGDCLFSDKPTRLSSFKQVCHILGSEACSVRRLMFDSFEDNAFDNDKDPKVWESIQKCAKNLGILHECFDLNCDQQPICDFRFTKEKMRQFADFVEAIVNGAGVFLDCT